MIYDNLKPVVDQICVSKERQFNHRFLALANHYLFEPVACTPASGWEKGQVEIPKLAIFANGCLRPWCGFQALMN
jgi:transposase